MLQKLITLCFFLFAVSVSFEASMNSLHPVYCPVCNGTAHRFVFQCKDHSISGKTFDIWQCNKCTHRFTFPVPPENEIGRYYQADHYISHSDTNEGFINRLYKIARRFTLSEKRRFVQRQTGLASGQLLDLGCGTGAFLHEMETNGWQTTGLEPDYNAREKALQLYRLSVHEPSHLFHLPEGSFDAVTMWHVMEHVYDLHGYMAQIKKLLRPNGILVIAVPNYTSRDATHYRSHWAAYDVPRHLHHFSPQSMQQLADEEGYAVIKRKPMWLDAYYIALLSEQYLNGKTDFIAATWQATRSNLATLANRSRCSSLIYVLKNAKAK